ncbi:Nramp family divalent metal transporter [Oscillospiraceae bacterium CM]|nr:Nramp family divalent metal transporter [Oscillospiraceae bacterium CM]
MDMSFLKKHVPNKKALGFLKFIGPGLLVTVGFIDPGNWAANIAAGSQYGYSLLWMVTLSTLMLIVLQHNAAHLGIVTGKCLSEAATDNFRPWLKNTILTSAVAASVSTALAELLGGAIALNMLFHVPIRLGCVFVLALVLFLQLTNSYKRIEKIIIGFVSLIGLSFLYELYIVPLDWGSAAAGWVVPTVPYGAMPIIMSVLGAVVMPHNLFLHSEIIQSREWHLTDEHVIKKQLKYEFADTLLSMVIGWAINSAMILIAAATFFKQGTTVTDLAQAQVMLQPILGNGAAVIFALALLFAGVASSITAGMAGGSIFAGMFGEPYDIGDLHSKLGVMITMVTAAGAVFLIRSPFDGLIYSQMFLSIQLPITIVTQIMLTSSKKVMGKYANSKLDTVLLWLFAGAVIGLNIALFASYLLK